MSTDLNFFFWVRIDVKDGGTLCHAEVFGTQLYIK